MKKLTLILALVLCVTLTACGAGEPSGSESHEHSHSASNGAAITSAQAQQIVLEDLGVDPADVTLHVHVGGGEVPSYLVYATVHGETMEYIINGLSGEILSITKSDHSH